MKFSRDYAITGNNMDKHKRKKHWETIFETKGLTDVSWHQETPEPSLSLLKGLDLPKTAKIIDIGAGDSFFVDSLLKLGYRNISVLDISAKALERAKKRLGEDAERIEWIVSDVTEFQPETRYDFWHDRAAFHFLTVEEEIEKYISTLKRAVSAYGYLVIGTFSESGPKKCSGLEITQYSESSLTSRLGKDFQTIECRTIDHKTPSDAIQNFLFCSFTLRRREPIRTL